MATVIGIDLGTTNCAVSFINVRGDAEILQNTEGDNITPSVVQFDGGETIIGIEAKNSYVMEPENTLAFVKRYMDAPDKLNFNHESKNYSAIDVSAIILKKLKQAAEAKLNDTVEEAVVTVPAYFDNTAKEATKQAAEIAGLKVLRLIMEPSAAALYYSYMNDHKLEGKRVLVYDLGGGTFDVSVVDLNSGKIDIVATAGDPKLGGKDYDEALIFHIKELIEEQFPKEVDWDDIEIKAELYDKIEQFKKSLSSKSSVKIKLPFAKKFKYELTKEEYKEITSSLTEGTIEITNDVVAEANKIDGKKIDEIILVGGSTKMPFIAASLEKELNIKPLSNVNPDEVVSQGAALLATKLSIEENGADSKAAKELPQNVQDNLTIMKINDIVPHSLGIIVNNGESIKNLILINHGESIPHQCEPLTGYGLSPNQKSAILKVTQGDDIDPEMVEIIGNTELRRPEGFSDSEFCSLNLTYTYDESGLIHAYGDIGGNTFSLEVKSEYKLNDTELKIKQEELSQMEVE